MTRNEFNREFALRLDATEGYGSHTINILNDRVYEAVRHLDLDADRNAKSVVDEAFRQADLAMSD